MNRELRVVLEAQLQDEVVSLRPVAGGDVSRAFEVRFGRIGSVFVKTFEGDATIYECEAVGLKWLKEPQALAVPKVLGLGCQGRHAYLALEWVVQGAPSAHADTMLGEGLAKLHKASAKSWGFPIDNLIASLPQANGAMASWPEFYEKRRLVPQLERAQGRGILPKAMRKRFDQLMVQLPEILALDESPSRLHGDLWSGNVIFSRTGEPILIDPSVYGGDREVDLAMMMLFGGFSQRVFDAYDGFWPRRPGWQGRVPIYQLYPLLVHVNLFGTSYLRGVEDALSAAGF